MQVDSTVILLLVGLIGGAVVVRLFEDKYRNTKAQKLKDEYSAKEKTLEHIHKEITGIELEEKKKTEAEILDFWNNKEKK